MRAFSAATCRRHHQFRPRSASLERWPTITRRTKRPVVNRINWVQQRIGKYNDYFTEWDSADALTDDKSLFYRFSGRYLNTGGFVDFSRAERVHLNPSVAWRPDEDTTFLADVEYYNQHYRLTLGLTVNPFNTTRPANVPVSRKLEGTYVPLSNNYNVFVGSDVTHRFNDMFTFKQRFLAAFLPRQDSASIQARRSMRWAR